MKEVQPTKAKKKVRRLYSKPVLILLVVVIVLLAKGVWGVYQKEAESARNVAMVQKELQSLEKRRDLLKKETEKLATEEGVEEAIRRKYQVSKDDERVLVVVDKPLPATVTEEDNGFFSKIWNSIFKKEDEQD